MSTISTQLNWGCSYIINDFYRPFVMSGASEKHYVAVSRIATFAIMLLSLIVTSKLETISEAWKFMLECSGGIGLVLILRWFWWRINAWSEIAALVAPFLIYPFLKMHFNVEFPVSLLIIVAWSTVVWLVVTFLTPPTEESVLLAFYRRVHPGGALWQPIACKLPDVRSDKGYVGLLVDWIAGSLCVTFSLLGVGKVVFGQTKVGLSLLAAALLLGVCVGLHLSRIDWKSR
jgi:hypothetical protein